MDMEASLPEGAAIGMKHRLSAPALPFLLDETRTLGLCGMVWEHRDSTDYHKQPWQAKISVTVSMASWRGSRERAVSARIRLVKGFLLPLFVAPFKGT